MTPRFADTSFLLALLNQRDRAHVRVREARRSKHPFVTSAFVLLELADHLSDPPNRALFPKVVEALRTSDHVEIVDLDRSLFERGVSMYNARPDKSWSLTDCTSFIIMQDLGLTDALTGDHHFEQAGFTALLR